MSAWNGKDQQKLRYAAEYNLTCEFNNMNTNGKSTQINSQSPHAIKDLLWQALQNREHERTSMAKCTRDQTTWWQIERWHRTMAPNANQVFRKWKSIRHIVNTVNKGIRQHSCQIQIQISVLSSPNNLSTNKTTNTSLKYESYIKWMQQEVEYEYVELV